MTGYTLVKFPLMRFAFTRSVSLLFFASLALAQNPPAAVLPAGTILQLRLLQPLSSYTSKPGEPLRAEVIAPVEVDGRVILPRLTALSGTLVNVHKIGLGFSRETAMLHLQFNQLEYPGQPPLPLAGRLSHLDDAREHVDDQGRIRGIRATDTFGNTLAGFAIGVASFDPMSMIFAISSTTAIFRVPDSSIILPPGTEFKFRVETALPIPAPALASLRPDPSAFPDPATVSRLEPVIRDLPFRTETQTDRQPSDLTSLAYLGTQDALERAFTAAGWVRSDRLDAKSTYGVMRSIVENQGYRAAPMSTLLLNGQDPVLTYAKTLNTFFSRHHLRIYAQPTPFEGRTLFTSTATYDSGIGFATAAKTFIHVINENIDEERSKVINDLLITGCVEGVSYLDRPWVPRDAKNATGDSLRTDGRLAVLSLNDCQSPRTVESAARESSGKLQQSAALRPVRSTVLTLRNDLLRGNVFYQTYAGIRLAHHYFQSRNPAHNQGQPRTFTYAGQRFLIVEGAAKTKPDPSLPTDAGLELHTASEAHSNRPQSYANRLLFSLSGGLSGYGNQRFSTQPLDFSSVADPSRVLIRFDINTHLRRGWTIAPHATLHQNRYVSHEFGYSRTSTNFQVEGRESLSGANLDSRSKATIRRFNYNTLVHLRPNGSRFRPYLALGPAVQLLHLADAAAQENRLLRLAARDVAFVISAYNFGSKPPLQGGGIFQFGLQYGGGARFHVTHRFFLRADFRETLSRQPNFFKGAETALSDSGSPDVLLKLAPIERHGLLRHQTATMGIGVAF